jgi:hypothetical protein
VLALPALALLALELARFSAQLRGLVFLLAQQAQAQALELAHFSAQLLGQGFLLVLRALAQQQERRLAPRLQAFSLL